VRAVALLLWLLASGCAAWRVVPLPPEAERHRAKTADGWEIELTRYRAQGEVKGPPVVLCHGISANARNMDLDAEHSFARYVASQGREGWTMSLRGTGESDRPDPSKGRDPITFDDFWRFDLPAVVKHVQRVSGSPTVHYAGHSMGGLVLYAYLSQGGEGIEAAATLGTPLRLDFGSPLDGLVALAPALIGRTWLVPSAGGAFLAAPFQTLVDDGPFQRFFYNPQSTRVETWQRLMAYGTADVAGGTALQLAQLRERGRFVSADGAIDFREGLARVQTPVLVVAARLDRIALAPAVKDGYRALGGPKEWLLITRANGARGEYGHMDLVIGERAAEEVWSKVLAFFDRHARKEP
jgi:pimeloyl-ACP methyl ester carboxylesterase